MPQLYTDTACFKTPGHPRNVFSAWILAEGDSLVASGRQELPKDMQYKRTSNEGEIYALILGLEAAIALWEQSPFDRLDLHTDYEGLPRACNQKHQRNLCARRLYTLFHSLPFAISWNMVKQEVDPCSWHNYVHLLSRSPIDLPSTFTPLRDQDSEGLDKPSEEFPFQLWHDNTFLTLKSVEELNAHFGAIISEHDIKFIAHFTNKRQYLTAVLKEGVWCFQKSKNILPK